MLSDIAKKAWKVSGKGVKIGVMSDSYNTKFGNPALRDVINGDLPGPENPVHKKPVRVSAEYPYGEGSDEGRAMLQIVHDVAPDAELISVPGSSVRVILQMVSGRFVIPVAISLWMISVTLPSLSLLMV